MTLSDSVVRTMVVSFAQSMRSLPELVFLLSCGFVSFGCEALMGAEFGDFERQHDAGTNAADGSAAAETSSDGDAQGGELPDTKVPPFEGGGTLCTPGDVHDIAGCPNCGRYVQICNERGSWDPAFCQAPS